MAYADYSRGLGRDDMQDDTFKLLISYSSWIDAAGANRDPAQMLYWTETLYRYIRGRIQNKKQRDDLWERINYLKDCLYSMEGEDADAPPTVRNSKILDDIGIVHMELLEVLDQMGILFKARANLDELVTRTTI